VPGFEGRWLAGFAPVGDTGFVVIVQTRYDAAVQPNTRLARRLVWRGSAAILAWLAACGTFLWIVVRRSASGALMVEVDRQVRSRRSPAIPSGSRTVHTRISG
jgi:hypothetical protein